MERGRRTIGVIIGNQWASVKQNEDRDVRNFRTNGAWGDLIAPQGAQAQWPKLLDRRGPDRRITRRL